MKYCLKILPTNSVLEHRSDHRCSLYSVHQLVKFFSLSLLCRYEITTYLSLTIYQDKMGKGEKCFTYIRR